MDPNLCIYVYVYIYKYICTHTHTHTHTRTHMCMCMHTAAYCRQTMSRTHGARIHRCVHICTYICTFMYICIHTGAWSRQAMMQIHGPVPAGSCCKYILWTQRFKICCIPRIRGRTPRSVQVVSTHHRVHGGFPPPPLSSLR